MPSGIFKRKPHSKETKEKISKNHRRYQTEETKRKLSKIRKGKYIGRIPWNKGIKTGIKYWFGKKRSDISGKRCYSWKGGITPLTKRIRHSFEYRQWRSDVFTRDDFTCQICYKRGTELQVDHHPKPFSKLLKTYNITCCK